MHADQHGRCTQRASPDRDRQYELPSCATKGMEIVAQAPVVCIFALTTEREVVLVRQFDRGRAVLNELPAGFIDEGENPP
jgi:hypothetical protein